MSHKTETKRTIDELTAQYQGLREKQIQANTELQSAKEQLDKLRQRAQAEFGTDDLDELVAKLAELEQENEQRRATYQSDLETIEGKLSAVENQLAEQLPDKDEKASQ